MLVKVAFKIDETKRLLIPRSTVVHRSEVIAVYVIAKNDSPKLRQIRLGQQFGNKVEVLAGLNPGEKIAIDPIKAGVVLKQQSQKMQKPETK
jgi:multidrug efflux pump subunit AcrA (membrane-fusion protein)